jgi:hypothetical protein
MNAWGQVDFEDQLHNLYKKFKLGKVTKSCMKLHTSGLKYLECFGL